MKRCHLVTLAVFILPLIASSVFFTGCHISYPETSLIESIEQLVKKEYNLDSEAKFVDGTLYLEIKLDELTTTEPRKINAMLEKLQGAVLSIVRVGLSTDADIQYMVVSVSDPKWNIGVRIIEKLQDVKDYFYQKISRGDYMGRMIMEIDVSEDGPVEYPSDEGITEDEFIGRLIVSQFSMLSRQNPFLSLIMDRYELKYGMLMDKELILSPTKRFDPAMFALARQFLVDKTREIAKKYDVEIETVKIIGAEVEPIVIDIASEPVDAKPTELDKFFKKFKSSKRMK